MSVTRIRLISAVAVLLATGCQQPVPESTRARRDANLTATAALMHRIDTERMSHEWRETMSAQHWQGDAAEANRTLLKMLELD